MSRPVTELVRWISARPTKNQGMASSAAVNARSHRHRARIPDSAWRCRAMGRSTRAAGAVRRKMRVAGETSRTAIRMSRYGQPQITDMARKRIQPRLVTPVPHANPARTLSNRGRPRVASLEQVGLLADDPVEQGLEAEPAGHVAPYLATGQSSHVRVDEDGGTRRLGHQLGLAGPLHGDEPPGRLVDRVAHGHEPMVAQDGCLVVSQGMGDALALLDVHHHAGVVVEHGVVVVEGAHVLGDGVEGPSEGGPRLAVYGVGVGRGNDVGAGGVDLGVDGECRDVDRLVPVHDLALVVDQDQVRGPDMAEVHTERIDPEMVGSFGVACRDVAGHPLVEAELREEAEGGGQALLAVDALCGGIVERHLGWQGHDLGHGDLLDAARRMSFQGLAASLDARRRQARVQHRVEGPIQGASGQPADSSGSDALRGNGSTSGVRTGAIRDLSGSIGVRMDTRYRTMTTTPVGRQACGLPSREASSMPTARLVPPFSLTSSVAGRRGPWK